MPYTTPITPLLPVVQTASGVSVALDLGVCTTARLRLDVSVAGVGPLIATVETARGATAPLWRNAGAFTVTSASTIEDIVCAGCDRYARVRWVLTPSDVVTFGVSGEAVLVYCTPKDIERVINGRAFVKDQNVNFKDEELNYYAESATDEVSSSLGAVFTLPLTAWGSDVRRKTAELAALQALTRRGTAIDDQQGSVFKAMRADIDRWLELVRKEEITLQHCVDATPTIEDGGAYVVTNIPRGWGVR